jgi:hypothetical protein
MTQNLSINNANLMSMNEWVADSESEIRKRC